MRKCIFLLFATLVLTTSCSMWYNTWYKPRGLSFKYDGKPTGLDTLININGYYWCDGKSYDNPSARYGMIFYLDGLVGFTCSGDIDGVMSGMKEDVQIWGGYTVSGDTLFVQFVVNKGLMEGVGVEKGQYLLESREEIVGIYPKYNTLFRYKFSPLEFKVDSTNWLLKKRWFNKSKKKR